MQSVSKFIRSNPLQVLLAVIFFATLFISYFHLITAMSQDLGRHILTGKIIVQTGQVPKTNLYSYTYPTFPFINHHWLSEVVFYLVTKLFGLSGLLLLTTTAMLTAFLLLLLRAGRAGGLLAPLAVGTLLLFVLVERTDLRPELFSFLFLSVFLVILYTYRERFTRLIFLLPILELLWVNMHIYFFIGIFVFGLFLCDHVIKNKHDLFATSSKLFFLSFILTCAATFLNPHGITGALYPLHVFQNYGYSIEENQTIFFLQANFHKPTIPYFELSVILLFLSLFLTLKKSRPIDWLLSISFTIIGAVAIRNFPLFVIAIFLPFSYSLSHLTKKVRMLIPPHKKQAISLIATLTLCCLLFWQMEGSVLRFPVTSDYEKGAEAAVTFFQKEHLPGPIFNNFDIGSYLEYRLYPQEKVFVDGRPEAYPATFFQNVYIPMQQNPDVFRNEEKQYGFQTIIFSHTDQTPWGETFLGWIMRDPSFRTVYLDDAMIILTKNKTPKQIGDDPSIISPFIHSRMSLLKLAHFYSVVGWNTSLQATLQALLNLDPTNCQALGSLALLMQKTNDPATVIYATRYQSSCH